MKLRYKLLMAFTLFSLIPIFIFGFYVYQITSSNAEEEALSYGEKQTQIINDYLDKYIENAVTITRSMIGDRELENLLKKDYNAYDFPIFESIQDEKLYLYYLNHLMNLFPNIDYTIMYPINQPYTIGYSNRNKTLLLESTDIKESIWYQETIQANGYWVYSGPEVEKHILHQPTVISISRVINDSTTQEPLGVVKVMIDQLSIQEYLRRQSENSEFSFVITNSEDEILASNDSLPRSITNSDHFSSNGSVVVEDQPYLVSSNLSEDTGYNVYALANKNQLLESINNIKNILLYLVIGTFILSSLIAFIISRGLVKPIENLKMSMNHVTHRKWEQLKLKERKDEVGDLTRHYNRMLSRLDKYVKLLIEKERQKKELEFKSLQAQINPHFLYNTLNTIKWCVYLEKNDQIVDMIDSLVFIFKFISKKTDDWISLKEEEEFLRHYITILNIRYEDEFDIAWDIKDRVKNNRIPILLLQPIIENAIVHGLESEKEMKKVSISADIDEANVLIIEIEDNGIGFDQNKKKSNEFQFSSIGIDNIRERIQLVYGSRGNMEINSELGIGTIVRLILPNLKG